ncbi:MAG: hydantoinase/oxoprolinase family protein [Rhodospirillales bacterium]|nr:hydantoinase/oxoprolinase family protein [Rhodospirillales bacterium]
MSARLAADIGGTFTDLVLLDAGGGVHVAKTLSTPGDFKEGVFGGVERVLSDAGEAAGQNITLADVDYFVHGATVVLNALLERKLPQAALVTTAGFRDVLEIMRTNNPRMYDLKWIKPKPIIPRHLRFQVGERVRHTGEVLRALDEEGTRAVARRIAALNIHSVALCFLHAYANPTHERRARELILEEYPDAQVTISSDVASELREFERTSTVAINASTIPIISAYLDGLSQALSDRGLERELFVMQSNGGVITSRTARHLPVRTVMSGPAGGVVGAQFIANRMGLRDVATIDIGGTSSDMGVISDGLARTVDQSAVEGWPIMAPTIEILAIGAGGGSIAWVDAGGALRVGPQSAGARPGPACYGLGGVEPTVSDACVALNRLNPDYFLAGEMVLDRDAAERAIRERIAEPLGMEVAEAAEGILRVVTANMNKAIRSILIARGFDIRQFALMAFGGAGGMVAGELLRIGDVQRLIVPSNPGAVSAIGMLATDLRHDFAQSNVQSLADAAWGEVELALRRLRERGAERLKADGVDEAAMHFDDALDLRYVGQDYYLRVYVDIDDLDDERIRSDFDRLHEHTYGFANPEFEIEMVNARVFAIGAFERPQLPEIGARGSSDCQLAPKARRPVFFDGAFVEADIYDVMALCADDAIAGPCIIEDPRSTIVVMPGQSATVDRFRNLSIEVAA